jgi:HlyD family secretion protein
MHRFKLVLLALFCLTVAACEQKPQRNLLGYVEAEVTRLAAPVAGRLLSLQVSKGMEVSAGAPLFELDQDLEGAAVAEASAHVQRQQFAAADLNKGRRQEEVAVLEAQAQQIQAQLALTEADLKRQNSLASNGYISKAALDSLLTRQRADSARLAEVRANINVARLASRDDTRSAAKADVTAAQAVLVQSEWRRDQKKVYAPVAGVVDDTLYRLGEWVPAGSPVVNLLPPDGVKLRFYVAQSDLVNYPVGARVEVHADGSTAWLGARVSSVAQSPEYTPPVIYSQENRAKLVFLIEALPDAPQKFSPGQPVDVRLELAK